MGAILALKLDSLFLGLGQSGQKLATSLGVTLCLMRSENCIRKISRLEHPAGSAAAARKAR